MADSSQQKGRALELSPNNGGFTRPGYIPSDVDEETWQKVPIPVMQCMNQLNADKENWRLSVVQLNDKLNNAKERIRKLEDDLCQSNDRFVGLRGAREIENAESRLSEKDGVIRNLEQEKKELIHKLDTEKKQRAAVIEKKVQAEKERIDGKVTAFLHDAKAYIPDLPDFGEEDLNEDSLLLCFDKVKKRLQVAATSEEVIALFYDAFCSGSQDPSSGTAVLMEPTKDNPQSSPPPPPQNASSAGKNRAEEGLAGDGEFAAGGSRSQQSFGGVVCQEATRSVPPEMIIAGNSGDTGAANNSSLDTRRRSKRVTKRPRRFCSPSEDPSVADRKRGHVSKIKNPASDASKVSKAAAAVKKKATLKGKTYRCVYCYNSTVVNGGYRSYQKHVQKYHASKRRRLTCTDCGMLVSTRDRLHVHKITAHGVVTRGGGTSRVRNTSGGNAHGATVHGSNPTEFSCTCGKTFSTRPGLDNHINERVFGKIFGCAYCAWSSYRAGEVLKHVKICHSSQMKKVGSSNPKHIRCALCVGTDASSEFDGFHWELRDHCIRMHNIRQPILFVDSKIPNLKIES